MEKEEFKEKVKGGFDKFVLNTKKAFGKAGNAVQDFSDKSVIRIEKKQFESKRATQYEKLGEYVANIFISGEKNSVSSDEEFVVSALSEIKKFNEEIKNREESLAAEAKKSSEEEKNAENSEKEQEK